MSLIGLIIVLIVVGLLLALANKLDIDGNIKNIINIVVLIAVVIFVLQAFGLLSGVDTIRVPQVH